MGKTKSRRHQKLYKMKGCSKKNCKHYLGGSNYDAADLNLAYPAKNVYPVPNPALAYTGKDPYSFLHKGGAGLGTSMPATVIPSNIPVNLNGANPTQPNTGPPQLPQGSVPQINPVNPQRGGSCSACSVSVMKGGSCGCGVPLMSGGKRSKKGGVCPSCAMGFMVGGRRHRKDCKCSSCKMMRKSQSGGNPGYPIPNGITGSSWKGGDLSSWPGVNGVQGDSNHFQYNNFHVDPQTSMINTGANPPFSIGGRRTKRKSLKGGALSNTIGQDLVNLGRQFQYGLGSAYNALQGYSPPANPMPWKGQLPNTPSLSTLKINSM